MTETSPEPDSGPNKDDYELQGYQDDFDTNEEKYDPATHELTDDPTATLGVPPEEFKDELDGLDTDEDTDDMREYVEDRDEGDERAA